MPQLSKPEPAQSSRCCHHQRVSIPAARGHRSLPSRAQQSCQDRHQGRLSPKQTASQMKLRTSSIWPRNKSTVLQRHQQPAARDALIYARPSNLLFSEENGNHSESISSDPEDPSPPRTAAHRQHRGLLEKRPPCRAFIHPSESRVTQADLAVSASRCTPFQQGYQ